MEKTPLNPTELERFKQILLNKRQDLLNLKDELEKQTLRRTSKSDQTGDLSSVPVHKADRGSETNLQSLDFDQLQREIEQIKDIDDALYRIENHTYGLCQSDGKPIQKERLLAIPWTRYCIDCEAHREKRP